MVSSYRLRIAATVCAVSLVSTACGRSAGEHLARGDQYLASKQYPQAIIEYRGAIQQDPLSGEAQMRLGDAYLAIPDAGNAARAYLTAAQLMPKSVEAQVNAGNMMLLGGLFENSRRAALRALEIEPNSIAAQALHANALAGLKRPEAALAQIQKIIALDPTRSDSYSLQGVLQLSEDVNRAEASFRKATAVDPKSGDARLVLASFLWAQGRQAEAEAELKSVIAADPANVPAHRALASFYLGTGRSAEAEAHLLAVARERPTVPVQLTLADYYMAIKRPADATEVLRTVAKQKEGFGEARSRLAVLAYDGGQPGEANRLIDETLAQDPTHPRALVTKAEFLFREGQLEAALVRATAAAQSDRRFLPAHYMVAAIHAAREDLDAAIGEYHQILLLNPQSIAAQLELARLHLIRGEAEPAKAASSQVAAARPGNMNAQLLLARALIGKGELTPVTALLQDMVARDSAHAEAQWLLGTVHLLQRDMIAARTSFELAMKLAPDAIEPLDGLVAIELASGAPAKARALIDARLARTPNDSDLLVLAGRAYFAAGEATRAEALLQKAIDVDPQNPNAYVTLAQLYAATGKLDKAMAEFERLAERDPKSTGAHTMVAVLLQLQNRLPQAEERYRQVLKLHPRAAVAANNLAALYGDQGGDLETALQLARIASEQLPNEPAVADTLGWILYKRGEYASAVGPLQACVAQAPRNAICQYHLGLAYLKINDTRRAREALETALRIDPAFDGAADARVILASPR